MKTKEKRERLLVGIYLSAKADGFDRYLDIREIADALNLERNSGELRLWVKDLDQTGKLEVSYTLGGGSDGGMSGMLTSYGLEEAEDLIEANPGYLEPSALDIADLAPSYLSSETIIFDEDDNLTTLSRSVRGSNSASEEDRIVALAEIAAFEAALSQPVIATDIVDRFVTYVLKWITTKFPDEAIKLVIAAIIVKLAPILAT